jgi:hypothetical protein
MKEETIHKANIPRVEYDAIHYWLKQNFGRANKCENLNCSSGGTRFEWALKAGCQYAKKRESFLMLCHSCHKKMDMTDGLRKKLRIYNIARQPKNKTGYRGVLASNGYFYARIKLNGQRKHLGSFPSAIEAAKAYDKASQILHGKLAVTNFG